MSLSILTKNSKRFCNICEENKLKNFFKITSLPYRTINNFSYNKLYKENSKTFQTQYCLNCKVIYHNNNVNFNLLYKNFQNYQKHSNFIKKKIKKSIKLKKKISLVNIGKNIELLDKKSLKKINYFNFDPSIKNENKINKKFNSLIKFSKKNKNKIDIILVDNFLSNIPDISKTIRVLRDMLISDGKIILYTHYGFSNLKKVDVNRFYYEHVYYFSLQSLLILFRKFELFISKVEFLENKDFLYLVFEKKPFHINTKLRNQINEEIKIDKNSYLNFKKILNQNKKKLSNLLSKKKYLVYGYGCSVGAISVIKAYGLENKIFKIFDDKPIVNKINFGKKQIEIKKFDKIKFNNDRKVILNLIPRHHKIIFSKIKKSMRKGDIFINTINNLEIRKF